MRQLNIMGVIFTIQEVDVVDKANPKKGEINYLTGEIKIDKNMPPTLKDQTLMHEIIHAICDLNGWYELGEDEEKVQGLATALHQVLAAQAIFSYEMASAPARSPQQP